MASLQLLPQPAGALVKWIVYGIVDAERAAGADLPTGLDGSEIVVVPHGSVAALLSPVSDEPASGERSESTDIDRALAFAGVVGKLHRLMTILPMRYGSFVYQAENAGEFLRRHESEFSEALASLEGCDEMGVRMLLPGVDESGAGTVGEPSRGSDAPSPGLAYLEGRRKHYQWQERAEQTCREWAERAAEGFAGLFRRIHWEYVVRPEGILLSLSFLVDRSRVPAFVEAFQRFEQSHPVTAICTGPLPPYVFVAALSRDTAMGAEMELHPDRTQEG